MIRALCLPLCLALAAPATMALADDLLVGVVRAELTPTVRPLALTGEIEAQDRLSAGFAVGGRIAELAVKDGEKVTAGQVLARIDRVQQEQSLRAAEAQVAAAEAAYVTARDDDLRQSQLFARGATTRIARDNAAEALASAIARQAQAAAGLAQAQDALDDTELRAPEDATVIQHFAEVGQVVGAAQPVIDLALGSVYDAVFDVPEEVLSHDVGGKPEVSLTPLGRPETVVLGHVRQVSPLVDAATGTVEVRIRPDGPIPGLSYGDAVRGEVQRSEAAAISLPWSTITATANGPGVWVVDPKSHAVELRPIRIRRFTSDSILLDTGISEGELVVTRGGQLLFPGRIVTTVEEAPV